MNPSTVNQKSKEFLLTILFLQFIVCITIFLDIPVARQVIGFIHLTFVPGIVLINVLKMKINGLVETILFAAGLSVASLMLIGLFVNELNPLFGIPSPLSLAILLPAINIFILICTIIAYLRNRSGNTEPITLSSKKPLAMLILLCIPALSIIGAITSGVYGDNRILLFMITAIATLFAFTTISKKAMPTKLYPFIVLIIAISLIYHSQMVSDKLISFGSDVGGEVFALKTIEKNDYWNPINPYRGDQSVGRTYAMLSVTILPTIYSVSLNLDSILVFKLLYSFLFALVPLGLYNLWKSFVGEKSAFISVFFFMSFQSFYGELLGLNKQMLGELFLVLLLTVILREKEGRGKKILCSLLFSFALIVSHYALAEIFLFLISFVLIVSILTKKPSRNVTATFVLGFFVIMFSWYIFTSSSSVFDSFLTFGQRVYNELGDFFNLQSREPEVLRGLGLEAPPTIWNMLSRMFAYATEVLMVIGFVSIILKKSKIYLEKDYFFLVFCSMLFLGTLIIVPGLSSTMNITRFYHILLFFLAPLCVLGANFIVNKLSKKHVEMKAFVLMLAILIPYFLFQTNFVYELTGSESWSISLSKYRMSAMKLYGSLGYKDSYSELGPYWLSVNVQVNYAKIYSDYVARDELRMYGLIYPGYVELLSNVTWVLDDGVIYLSALNVNEEILIGNFLWNLSEIHFLQITDKIYTNGGSDVYKNP